MPAGPFIVQSMQKKKPASSALDALFARAEGYANFAMRKFGNMAPLLLAATEQGELWFVPTSLADVRAKDNFANTTRLICAAYNATAVVMALESWASFAKPEETIDTATPPSEAFDRREFVVLMGETAGQQRQKLLPIIRTDAGGFFGFGEFDSDSFTSFQGRFAGLLPPKVPTAEGRAIAKALLEAMGVTDSLLRQQFPRN
jgi:hypothetical protein